MTLPTPKRTIDAHTEFTPLPVRAVAYYVHIPFCSSRCRYCDFYFETGWSSRVLERTLDRIVDEAKWAAESLGAPAIRSIYFGGGTPSVIPPEVLGRFLQRFRSAIGVPEASTNDRSGRDGAVAGGAEQCHGPVEWTFEANPESVGDDLLAVLRECGVNRLSLGVQSFQDDLLSLLGRRARRAGIESALAAAQRWVRSATVNEPTSHSQQEEWGRRPASLNVDLITGIPGQTSAMLEDDLALLDSVSPEHISVYSLTVEARTPLAQMLSGGQIHPLSTDVQDALWIRSRDRLIERGYSWYEISNFSREGFESVHNRGYWALHPYVGLGPGATSTLPGNGWSGHPPRPYRTSNPNLFLYSRLSTTSWRRSLERLTDRDILFEHFITGLRTSRGVSIGRIASLFRVDLARRWRGPIRRWSEEGRVDVAALESSDPHLVLREPQRLMLNPFLVKVRDEIDSLFASDDPPCFAVDEWAQ